MASWAQHPFPIQSLEPHLMERKMLKNKIGPEISFGFTAGFL